MGASADPSTSPSLLRQLRDPAHREQAWQAFLDRYGPLIYGWCRRAGLQHADAEEVSSRVRSRLVEAMRTFTYDPARRFRGWLKTVVDNTVRSFWRELTHNPGARGSGASAVQETLEQIEAAGAVDELILRLDDRLEDDLEVAYQIMARVRERVKPRTWQAFWDTTMGQEPAMQVATRLGMTVAAVYVAKNRVGNMLRDEVAKLPSRHQT
jgi:RNA polymerase sigma-70 factor (ECF subfamily)